MKIRVAFVLVQLLLLSSGLTAQPKTLQASGRTVGITQDSITIQPGDTITIGLDATTRVIGKDVGKRTRALKVEGRAPTITDLVDVGDSVTVKYTDMPDGKRQASEIKIHMKTLRKH